MSATIELFERYKQALAVAADRPAAHTLGVKVQTVSNWRTRGSQAEPWLIETLCRKLGEDPARWLLRAQAEQAPDPTNGAVWRRLAKRLGVAFPAAAAMLARADETVAGAWISFDIPGASDWLMLASRIRGLLSDAVTVFCAVVS